MNIAFVVGISKYERASALPACENDARRMGELLIATGKYDEVLCVQGHNTSANDVKTNLRRLVQRHRGSRIDEAFIYFSGHGTFVGEAYLCCSDFNAACPAGTSLSNGEIDELLRGLAPEVAVKVLDACNSGLPYVKDVAGFEKALRASKLNAFICMASSRLEQSSYASTEASFFTAKWIESALHHQGDQIYYRDIQARLADAFIGNPRQTPFFVTQGTGLEVFSHLNESLRRLALSDGSIKPIEVEPRDTSHTQSLRHHLYVSARLPTPAEESPDVQEVPSTRSPESAWRNDCTNWPQEIDCPDCDQKMRRWLDQDTRAYLCKCGSRFYP